MNTSLVVTMLGIILIMVIIKSMIGLKPDPHKEQYKGDKQKLYVLKGSGKEKRSSNSNMKKKMPLTAQTNLKQGGKVINLQERRQAKQMVMEKRTQSYFKMRK